MLYNFGVLIASLIFLVVLALFTWMMICYAAKIAKHVYNEHVSRKIVHYHFWIFKLDISPHAISYVIGVFIIAVAVIWLIDSLIIFSAEHAV